MYVFSKSRRLAFAGGIIKLLSNKDKMVKIVAAYMYGRSNLLKLTPLDKMAMISVLYAILEVKNITAINVKSGLKRFTK
jgi:hypothetical protein